MDECKVERDFNKLHTKVDMIAESVCRIEGKLEGMAQEKNSGMTFLGIISAIMLGVWNLIK